MAYLPETAANEAKANSFLQTIKRSTADLHLLLESNQLLTAIMKPGVSVSEYYCYLILMKNITEVYEKEILTRLPVPFRGHGQRRASRLIADDMQNTGYVLPVSMAVKDYTLTAENLSVPFSLGFMYVMEGSRLGGRVICKHIHRHLGFHENHGAKFISDHGVSTIRLWKEFLVMFSGYVAENDCEEETIEGATYAFSSIYSFFESNRLVYAI